MLSAAGEAAGSIRSEAEADAAETIEGARIEANATRVEANDYAERTRTEADEYAQAERGKADAYALRMREEAGEQAGKIIADGQSRRDALESVISDLAERRDKLLDELEEIAGSIAGHRQPGPAASRRPRRQTARSLSEAETTEATADRVSDFRPALEAALAGGPERHHSKTAEQGKLEARERVERLVDPESFAEEALLANWEPRGWARTAWSRAWR